MTSRTGAAAWASEEFGHCAMRDPRNRERLLAIAEMVCEQPAARLAEVFTDPADGQAAEGQVRPAFLVKVEFNY